MSSYQGQDTFGYEPVGTVDEVADYTGMMGAESVDNMNEGRRRAVKESPTKSLAVFWAFLVITYLVIGFVFRGHTA